MIAKVTVWNFQGKTLSSALLFCITCPRVMDAVKEELSTISGEVIIIVIIIVVNKNNKCRGQYVRCSQTQSIMLLPVYLLFFSLVGIYLAFGCVLFLFGRSPFQTKYWKHFHVQVQLTDRPRLPYIQAVFDLMISYQPWVKTHPVPQRFFWRQLAWRQFFRSHLRARRPDQFRFKIPNLFLGFYQLPVSGRETCAADRQPGPGDCLINQPRLISW